MTIQDISRALDAEVKTGRDALDRQVCGVYVSDMLSDVLAHARNGQVWITLQTHINIVAVASMVDLAAIVIINGRTPGEETLNKAGEEHVPLLVTELPAFEAAGRLYGSVTATA